jgi:hypothetical protein
MHVQSATCLVRRKQSAGGKRASRERPGLGRERRDGNREGACATPESAGRRGRLCRLGERRSCGRRRGGSGRPRLLRPHHLPDPRRRAGKVEFREHRIGVDRHGSRTEEITGDTDNPDGDGNRQESRLRVGDRETAIRRGHDDRARCVAASPQGGPGIGTRRRRLQLNLNGWRRRLESVPGQRGAAGQAQSRCGNHDETTHSPSVTLVRLTATFPGFDHRSVSTATQPREP